MNPSSPGVCEQCGTPLSGEQRKWCSNKCGIRNRVAAHRKRTGYRHTVSPTSRGVIALDGEGIDGRYVLIADNKGRYIEDYAGLQTERIFQWLVSLPVGPIKFGFSFGYDVNMILGDFRSAYLMQLRRANEVRWGKYYVRHLPSKQFFVKDLESGRYCNIFDLFPFVQCSFVKFLRMFQLATPEEIDRISEMKDQRSSFANVDPAEIRNYCISECQYLAAGAMNILGLFDKMDYRSSAYYSPGSLAAIEMGRQNILNHYTIPSDDIRTLTEGAYYGGRSEAATVGKLTGRHFQYDINSAYPYALSSAPCFSCGHWRRTGTIVPTGVYRVRWSSPDNSRWGPYPWRPRFHGSLKYPVSGESCLWGVEIIAGLPLTDSIKVIEGFEWVQECEHKPFDYLRDLYYQRQQLKEQEDPTEFVVKLVLNSTYGKMAQRKGWKGRKPRYQSLEWAGYCTATTRAMLSTVAVEHGDSLLMFATDAVLATEELPLECGTGLGQWDYKPLDDVFIVGAGFYFGLNEDGSPITRTRGVRQAFVDRDLLLSAWAEGGKIANYPVNVNRFIGYRLALVRREGFKIWRRFVQEEMTKTFDLQPRRRWTSEDPWDGNTIAPTLAMAKRSTVQDEVTYQTLRELVNRYADAEDLDRLASSLVILESHNRPTDQELPHDQPDWIIDDWESKKVQHKW